MTNYQAGDAFAMEDLNTSDADCTAQTSGIGYDEFCNLRPGHEGKHVAANADLVVVATWNQS